MAPKTKGEPHILSGSPFMNKFLSDPIKIVKFVLSPRKKPFCSVRGLLQEGNSESSLTRDLHSPQKI
jgi:hypothetical protein